jgi:hypothetical protein
MFAASISSLLQAEEVSFLTDSQILVNYFNGPDLSSPPHWEAKPFTQRFINSVANKRIPVLKVQRSMNTTAHTLASQALKHSGTLCTLANNKVAFRQKKKKPCARHLLLCSLRSMCSKPHRWPRSFLSFGAGRLLGGGAEALHVGAGKTLKESDSSR